jgi:hypothetical protein
MAILPRSCVTLHAQLLAADTTLLVCVRVCIFSLSFVKLNVRPANSPWAPNEQFLSSLRAFCFFAARLGITCYPIASFITHSSQPFAAGHTFITVIAPLMCLAPVLIWNSRTTLFHHFTGVTLALSPALSQRRRGENESPTSSLMGDRLFPLHSRDQLVASRVLFLVVQLPI